MVCSAEKDKNTTTHALNLYRVLARAIKYDIDAGFRMESLLNAVPVDFPCNIFLTGVSIFLPEMV
jgi:hypothetical protein